jgi:hypothetical protein
MIQPPVSLLVLDFTPLLGLFRSMVSDSAASLPALPVPVPPVFRDPRHDKPSPSLVRTRAVWRLGYKTGRP